MADGEVKIFEYIIRIGKHQLESFNNASDLFETLRPCTGEKAGNQLLWGEMINDLSWSLGSLLEDEQVLALVNRTEACKLKLVVEKLVWVLQKAEQKGYLDENLKATLKPFIIPRQVNDFHLDPKPYENTKRMHILIQILQDTNQYHHTYSMNKCA